MSTSPAIALPGAESAAASFRLDLDRPRAPFRLLGWGLGAGVVTRWAFGEGPLGLGFLVWTLAMIAGFALVAGREGRQRAKGAHAWVIAAVFFSAMVAVRDADWLVAADVGAVLGVLLLAAHDAVGAGHRSRLFELARDAVRPTFQGLRQGAGLARSLAAHDPLPPGAAKPVLRGLALAAPVVIVLGALLALGDARFRSAVGEALAAVPGLGGDALGWIIVPALSGLYIAGIWAFALRRSQAAASSPSLPASLGAVEGLMVVGSVVLLFGLYLGVQAQALFFADPSLKGTGITYAGQAREGFAELTLASAITWGLVEQLRRRVRDLPPTLDTVLRVACSLVLAQALVLLVSSQLRLTLYEETYGYTVRRILAHAGIAFLGLCLASRLVTLWVAQRAALGLVVASGLGVLAALNVMNPEQFIVRANVQRPQDVVVIDWDYLGSLSSDALPALAVLLDEAEAASAFDRIRHSPDVDRPAGIAQLNLARSRAKDADCAGL